MNSNIPAVGLGTCTDPAVDIASVVETAIRVGYRHVDTAVYYFNQKEIGSSIKKLIDEGFIKREDIWLTSKLWPTMLEEGLMLEGLETILEELQTEYLDLLLVHWPVSVLPPDGGLRRGEKCKKGDNGLAVLRRGFNIADVWAVMESFVESGKVRHIGLSNFPGVCVAQVLSTCRIKPYVNQLEVHPFCPMTNHVEYCLKNDIKVSCHTPLGRMGNPKPGMPLVEDNTTIKRIAAAHETSTAAVVLAWSLQRGPAGMISVLPRSKSVTHMTENLHCTDLQLTAEEMKEMGEIAKETFYRVCDPVKDYGIPLFE